MRSPNRLFPIAFLILPVVLFACWDQQSVIGQDAPAAGRPGKGNRLSYLDEFLDPYYVSSRFPKLTTPQWVEKEGVEAVVVLAIDDMRDTAKYETYLRPILERLKKIDGRAPVSIMTNRVNPADPQLAQWLKEGLSIEVHTYDHPCPCLQKGDFPAAKKTYERCVDLMAEIPNNRPVAFRMPCCDSLNTPSPRFFAEIFNRQTEAGNHLSIDSSVFQVFTAADPDLPRELVLDSDGQPRFRKYIPFSSFVNTIENYPYPYVIGGKCWQFPCMVPSDWEAQHLHRPNNPITVRDMKAALDATVIKQGVFNLVFHPHGWIRNQQVIELIDHAQKKHGDKVLFLTFQEALAHLNKHLLGGHPLRDEKGDDNGVRLLDLNDDGYLDVVCANEQQRATRIWNPQQRRWRVSSFPAAITAPINGSARKDKGLRFGVLRDRPAVIVHNEQQQTGWLWTSEGKWAESKSLAAGLGRTLTSRNGIDQGVRLRDLDHQGDCELIVANPTTQQLLQLGSEGWEKSPLKWPEGIPLVDAQGRDAGTRLVDIDDDGYQDLLFSDDQRFAFYLWNSTKYREPGWSIKVSAGKRSDEKAIPMIVRAGANNGAWFHSGLMWVQNEDTHRLPNLVDRRRFAKLLGKQDDDFPSAKTPEQARRSIRVPDGLQVELMASEPLVNDPIAIDWGMDGALYVVEMGDYPLGVDGSGGSGGRVKKLTDVDGDGKFDKATVFVDKLPFPNGVKAWRNGVLITAAPDVLYAEDADGDGKAEKVEKLYSGFRPGNQQHRMNGLRWGLDNWLYLANGDSGGDVRHVSADKATSIRGRDLRIHPDSGGLQLLAGQTQFGRDRDDWGNWFGGNNSNPMWQYVLEERVTRRNPHVKYGNLRPNVFAVPGASPVFPRSRTLARFNDFNKSNRFTSACSPIVYRDHRLGSEYAGNVFVCEPVHNLVHREILTTQDGLLRSRRAPGESNSEFLASSDNWFRPTMVRTGPDGCLWVVDMYRFVIEHPEWIPQDWQKRLKLRDGHDRGRIYRITPVGKIVKTPPPLAEMSSLEVANELQSSSGTRRDMAQQLLIRRLDLSVVPVLRKMTVDGKLPQTRLQALCTLAGLEGGSALQPRVLFREAVLAAFQDKHPGVRRWAVYWAAQHRTREVFLPELLKLLDREDDVRVRMEIAIALGEYADPEAAIALGRLAARTGDNPYQVAAVLSSLNADNLESVVQTVANARSQTTPPLLPKLLAMAAATNNDAAWRTVLRQAAKADSPAPDWVLAAASQIAARLGSRSKTAWSDPQNVQAFQPLLATVRRDMLDSAQPLNRRILCLNLLGAAPIQANENRQAMAKLLAPRVAIDMQRAAVRALGQTARADTSEVLFAAWSGSTPAVRNEILDVLLSRDEYCLQLLVRIEAKQFAGAQLGARRRQQLLDHQNQKVRNQAKKLLGQVSLLASSKLIDQYVAACASVEKVNAAGIEKGRALFAKKCGNCHRLSGVGHAIGPDLSALTNKSPRALMTAMLAPNAQVEDKYLEYAVLLQDGRQVRGMLISETATSLTLAGPEAKTFEVLRSDIDQLRSTGKSMMPEGMQKEIPLSDAPALVAFLQRVGPPPKRFPGNTPQLVKARDDGSIHAFATHSRIYGPSVVLEEKYRNLGFWASPQDRAVWTVEIPRAGKYRVTIDYACADNVAGNRYLVEAGEQTVGGRVEGTSSWDQYRRATAGEVVLPKGPVQLTFRSDGPIRQFLLDLRGVILRPLD